MGGGGSKAKTLIDVSTKTATKVINKNMQKCQSGTIQVQDLDITGSEDVDISDLNWDQKVPAIDMQCFQSAENVAKLTDKLKNDLTSDAKAQSVALLGALGGAKAEADNYIRQEINRNITNESIQACVSNVAQKQGIKVKDSKNVHIKGINWEQAVDGMIKIRCSQQTKSIAETMTDIQNKITASATAKQENPLDFIAKLFQGPFLIFAIIAGIALLVLVIIKFAMGGNSSAQQPRRLINASPYKQIPYKQAPPYKGGAPFLKQAPSLKQAPFYKDALKQLNLLKEIRKGTNLKPVPKFGISRLRRRIYK